MYFYSWIQFNLDNCFKNSLQSSAFSFWDNNTEKTVLIDRLGNKERMKAEADREKENQMPGAVKRLNTFLCKESLVTFKRWQLL